MTTIATFNPDYHITPHELALAVMVILSCLNNGTLEPTISLPDDYISKLTQLVSPHRLEDVLYHFDISENVSQAQVIL